MLHIMIVDDELPALAEIEYLLTQFEEVELVGAFSDPLEAIAKAKEINPDAALLDINMPEIDGFTLAKALVDELPKLQIVFATAYDEYALKAFEINAVDYILKPILEERLSVTIERLLNKPIIQFGKKSIHQGFKESEFEHSSLKCIERLAVWKSNRIILLKYSDILYGETLEGETYVYTKSDKYTVAESLHQLMEKLDTMNFFRCHRNYVINMDNISEIIPWFNNTYLVKFAGNDAEIPISRRNVKLFKERLQL